MCHGDRKEGVNGPAPPSGETRPRTRICAPRRRRCADVEKAEHRLGCSRVCVWQVLVEGWVVEITQPFTERLRGHSFMNVAFRRFISISASMYGDVPRSWRNVKKQSHSHCMPAARLWNPFNVVYSGNNQKSGERHRATRFIAG